MKPVSALQFGALTNGQHCIRVFDDATYDVVSCSHLAVYERQMYLDVNWHLRYKHLLFAFNSVSKALEVRHSSDVAAAPRHVRFSWQYRNHTLRSVGFGLCLTKQQAQDTPAVIGFAKCNESKMEQRWRFLPPRV